MQGFVHGRFVIATIVIQGKHVKVGELVRLDEVLAAQLHRVHPQFIGQHVHSTFQHVGRFRAARPAISVGRGSVGIDANRLEMDVRNCVRAGGNNATQHRHARSEQRHIAAHVAIGDNIQACNLTVFGSGHADIVDVIAAMNGPDETFAAGFGPFNRLFGLAGSDTGNHFLGVGGNLAAKTAADIRRDHPDFMLGNPDFTR